MTTLFVKRLTVIDNSLLDARRGLLGESWQVDIELEGELDRQGMVLDFGEIKRTIKQMIDQQYDHKLIVPADAPRLATHDYADGLHLSFCTDDGRQIEHRSPQDAVRLIPGEQIDAGSLASVIADTLRARMPKNVTAIRVHLWPESCEGAFFHYSHGLKHHDGNCQRVAHGHRSRIEILRNGQRDKTLENEWAARWRDIYIGTREDVIGRSERDNQAYFEFGYRSAQGEFGLTLAQTSCYLIDTDSTIENIAQHVAETLKSRHPDDSFVVYAYEGVDKGAIGKA